MARRWLGNAFDARHFQATQTEDRKLRKELALEVLALKAPFGATLPIAIIRSAEVLL
jgi:hypothetical protein